MQIAQWGIWAEYTLYASLESSFPFYHLLSWLKPAQNYLIGCSILLYANGYVPADNIYTPVFQYRSYDIYSLVSSKNTSK